jgi:hypothetical protein
MIFGHLLLSGTDNVILRIVFLCQIFEYFLEILGSHNSEDVDCGLLGCDAV